MFSSATRPVALVADDEPDIRRLVGRILSRAGWDVALASDGQEAWEAAQRLRPQIIVLDLMMPRFTGYGVIRRLNEHASVSHIPVLLLTGVRPEQLPHEFQLREIDTYLTKPFLPADLVSAVSRLTRPVPNNQDCPVSAGAFGPLDNPKELSAWPAS